MQKSNVSQHFIELLYSLGNPVKVDQHIGWTGHVSTSHKILCKYMGREEITRKISQVF